MDQQQVSRTTSRALAKKPALAVVAKDEGRSLPVEPTPTIAGDEIIRQRAYALYEARGRVDGHELEDWLNAEAQLAQAQPVPGPKASRPSR